MNDDSARNSDPFTVSDLVDWLVQVFFLPGDLALGLLIRHASPVAQFLELGREDYGGTLSILISVLFWLALLLLIGTLINFIRNLDRRLTAGVSDQYEESRRKLRVAAQLIRSRRARRQAERDKRT